MHSIWRTISCWRRTTQSLTESRRCPFSGTGYSLMSNKSPNHITQPLPAPLIFELVYAMQEQLFKHLVLHFSRSILSSTDVFVVSGTFKPSTHQVLLRVLHRCIYVQFTIKTITFLQTYPGFLHLAHAFHVKEKLISLHIKLRTRFSSWE